MTPPNSAPAKPRLPVLVVEDDEATREVFADALEDAGFSVATAANGKEALDYLIEHGASLVFLDLKMPVVDGNAFIDLLRNAARLDARLDGVPVVVVTGERSDRVPAEIPIMRKPCDLNHLIELAREYSAG